MDLRAKVSEWTEHRLMLNAGYYSGRPPYLSDLNSMMLEAIYLGIKKDVGAEQAVAFVRFVNRLSDLSASAFITAFERFASGGFKNTEIKQHVGDRMQPRGEAQAFGALMSALASRDISEDERKRKSNEIKATFILDHYDEIPEEEQGLSPAGSLW